MTDRPTHEVQDELDRCRLCRQRDANLRPVCVENRVEIPIMCDGCYIALRDAGRLEFKRDAEVFGYD